MNHRPGHLDKPFRARGPNIAPPPVSARDFWFSSQLNFPDASIPAPGTFQTSPIALSWSPDERPCRVSAFIASHATIPA